MTDFRHQSVHNCITRSQSKQKNHGRLCGQHSTIDTGNYYITHTHNVCSSQWYKPVLSVHCLAMLDLGKGVEQPFNCLITQNCQAVQYMRRLMDWTFENNMVEGFLFCANFTNQGRRYHAFVQAGAETFDTGVEGHQIVLASSFELFFCKVRDE